MPLYRGEYDDVFGPFVDAMKYKMANSKRFHGQRKWEQTDVAWLLAALEAEVAELREAVTQGTAIEGVLEAVDVANVAMMIADRLGMPRRDPDGAAVRCLHPKPNSEPDCAGKPTCRCLVDYATLRGQVTR